MIWLLRGYGSIYHAVASNTNEAFTVRHSSKELLASRGLEPRSSDGHFAPLPSHRCGPEPTQLSDIRGYSSVVIPLHQSAGDCLSLLKHQKRL